MFEKELKVKGKMIEGKITGNWSVKSHYAFKPTPKKAERYAFDVEGLDMLISELTIIKEKLISLNEEYNSKDEE